MNPKDTRTKVKITITNNQSSSICPSFRVDKNSKDSVIKQINEFLKKVL